MLAAGADFCYNENRYRVHSACALRASEGDEAGCMLPEISGKGANHLPVQYAINEKMKEAAASVLPVTVIVAVLCLALVPVDTGLMLSFLIGSLLLIVGMGLFTLGADMSMSRIGNLIGAKMTKSRRLWLILALSFVLGAAITIAEPDLQVLATNVFYALVFLGAFLSDRSILSVAFDSGGVTTGPMTVPFIMALGVGVASIRSDEDAKADSFGLVALCSIGPVAAVLLLGAIYQPETDAAAETVIAALENTVEMGGQYLHAIPEYMGEVAVALLPIFAFFLVFQVVSLHLRRLPFARILAGILYTYVGLVLFLTGVNIGFSPLGYVLGAQLTVGWRVWLLVPVSMLMGWYIINAEPAVHILNRQVEELSAGTITARAMGVSLSVAVAAANGLAMVRVLTGIPILWFLVPGYAVALGLSFFVPRTFTAIAFDSGGVASGPLTATFMLPLAMGACGALGGNVMTDAFGLVALVAMMPLITVQAMGAIYVVKSRRSEQTAPAAAFGDDDIIELWEVA